MKIENQDDDYFKREEDRKWREKVDHEQVTLMTGLHVLDQRLGRIESTIEDIDELLRGDRKDNIGGLIARFHGLENSLAKINAVLFVDPTGKKGLIHDIQQIMEGREDRRFSWANITKILVALLTSGMLYKFLPDILSKTKDPFDSPEYNAARKHVRHYRYRVVPPPEKPPETEDVQ